MVQIEPCSSQTLRCVICRQPCSAHIHTTAKKNYSISNFYFPSLLWCYCCAMDIVGIAMTFIMKMVCIYFIIEKVVADVFWLMTIHQCFSSKYSVFLCSFFHPHSVMTTTTAASAVARRRWRRLERRPHRRRWTALNYSTVGNFLNINRCIVYR